MHNNNFLTSSQHGFLSKRSTLTTQLSCYNNWFKAIDNNTWIDVIYLDFSKAFDTVSYNKLLYKINKYGFSICMYKWLESF